MCPYAASFFLLLLCSPLSRIHLSSSVRLFICLFIALCLFIKRVPVWMFSTTSRRICFASLGVLTRRCAARAQLIDMSAFGLWRAMSTAILSKPIKRNIPRHRPLASSAAPSLLLLLQRCKLPNNRSLARRRALRSPPPLCSTVCPDTRAPSTT